MTLRKLVWVLVACSGLTALGSEPSLPVIVINQNHTPAGVLRNGVLTIELEIGRGEWHPEAEDGMTLSIYAFGEAGRPLQNPGPLIRVPQGTKIRASLHNTIDTTISVHGLGAPGSHEVVRLAPGAAQNISFTAATPGLYFYWGATEADTVALRHGVDSELTGAFVVDPPGKTIDDEIFVLEMISEHAGLASRETLATINGKSWPYTQRFDYEVGQPVHWRWINATNEPHALHLHGFYYRIDAFNHDGSSETYTGALRPTVVTQRIGQGETFDMSWSLDRPGRWLFHCHMLIHMTPPIVPELPGLTVRSGQHADDHGAMHDGTAMGQLVLGITSRSKPGTIPATTAWHADRKLQLEISERNSLPRYALIVRDLEQPRQLGEKPGLIGPPIVLTRDQPVEIEVINKLKDPTAIHWHGIELESYYDGVPGWSGADKQITPAIAPGTSFIVRMSPPRAGTFIYHTHWHDSAQLTNGLYGPLIVLPPGQKFDPSTDIPFVFSLGDFGDLHNIALINGSPQSKTLQLQAGKKYRFRLINISTNNQAMQASLRNITGPLDWTILAKDGADLPPERIRRGKAQVTVSVGETYDVEFSSDSAQDVLLDLFLPGQKLHTMQTLSFVVAEAASKEKE